MRDATLSVRGEPVDQLTGGRLELGLGTGYVRSEFDAAGLAWESAGARVDRLANTVSKLDVSLRDEDQHPRPVQRPRPPLLLGGHGRRMLALAAAHAEIVAFTGAVLVEDAPAGTLHLVSAETWTSGWRSLPPRPAIAPGRLR